MKVLVTGGAGFIGSHVVEALIKKGFSVRALDIKTFEKKGVECVQADIRDNEQVLKAVQECDYVIHLAALMSVPESNEKPEEYTSVNVTGTANVLEAAKQQGVKRVVLASSAAVYAGCEMPWEESKIGEPISIYAANKIANEKLCKTYSQQGMECIALRFMNVFGPRQPSDNAYAAAIPKFITQLRDGKTPVIYGNGTQTRDFIYVKNVAESVLRCISAENLSGEIINVASGKSIKILELLRIIAWKIGVEANPEFAPEREGDIKLCEVDVAKSSRLLGDYNIISFEEGLDETIEYYRRQA